MMDAIFVDSNVPMYLVGAAHPCRDALEAFIRAQPDERYVTSAEVYQEVIHRYAAIDRREAIADAFALLDALVDEVMAVEHAHVRAAHDITLRQHALSGRDCLHLAVMGSRGIRRILTMDRGFESWPDIERLP